MILVDTAIWVDHLGKGDPLLEALLDADRVAMHAFVIGEIALGNLRDRDDTLEMLRGLPIVPIAEPDEVLAMLDTHALAGSGIGYVDAHLIASTLLADELRLWTRDKRLQAAAQRLGIAAHPIH